ncbi:AraD1 family protein [Sphingomonas sp. Leaf25]|uniref:AraD1 family protein n=1 Tax=Sphingomonas sp. Leaf25 TaxID=1735692 RepID=UPI0006F275A0|nr:AraD1 family protein [Sphingomonas sp. Leaf25]KQM97696.1 FAH family protein [Sphingomonas sp. Leaf25]
MTLRLLQRVAPARAVIAATDSGAHIVPGVASVRDLALRAIDAGQSIADTIAALGQGEAVDLTALFDAGQIGSPIDHEDPAHVVMTGTGLTHLGSAEGRDKMHRAAAEAATQTDSMRMFLEGVEGGKPAAGAVGQQPEWFYKGDGGQMVAPGGDFTMPAFAQDGGEEPELAGIYLIGPDGTPHRIGLTLANEFSDHVTERHNYLWLAHSKLRQASLGPELLVGTPPEHVEGTSRIVRDGETIWEKPFLSGEANMSHSLSNLEHHHFKYALFRRPGDIHVHFFGTATLSFSDGIATQEGDVFEIAAAPFVLPLRNTLTRAAAQDVSVLQL